VFFASPIGTTSLALVGKKPIACIPAKKGYRRHAQPDYKLRVFSSGQKRGDDT
jgi:hypothetical protein